MRPSGHDIGKAFNKDNGGAIPPNLLQIPNTESHGQYLHGCKTVGEKQHPARFPAKLPEFFINMLTEPGDLVLDIFAGSNTTGQVAETEKRRRLAFELSREYVGVSAFRFLGKQNTHAEMRKIFDCIEASETVDLNEYVIQRDVLPAAPVYSFASGSGVGQSRSSPTFGLACDSNRLGRISP